MRHVLCVCQQNSRHASPHGGRKRRGGERRSGCGRSKKGADPGDEEDALHDAALRVVGARRIVLLKKLHVYAALVSSSSASREAVVPQPWSPTSCRWRTWRRPSRGPGIRSMLESTTPGPSSWPWKLAVAAPSTSRCGCATTSHSACTRRAATRRVSSFRSFSPSGSSGGRIAAGESRAPLDEQWRSRATTDEINAPPWKQSKQSKQYHQPPRGQKTKRGCEGIARSLSTEMIVVTSGSPRPVPYQRYSRQPLPSSSSSAVAAAAWQKANWSTAKACWRPP